MSNPGTFQFSSKRKEKKGKKKRKKKRKKKTNSRVENSISDRYGYINDVCSYMGKTMGKSIIYKNRKVLYIRVIV